MTQIDNDLVRLTIGGPPWKLISHFLREREREREREPPPREGERECVCGERLYTFCALIQRRGEAVDVRRERRQRRDVRGKRCQHTHTRTHAQRQMREREREGVGNAIHLGFPSGLQRRCKAHRLVQRHPHPPTQKHRHLRADGFIRLHRCVQSRLRRCSRRNGAVAVVASCERKPDTLPHRLQLVC